MADEERGPWLPAQVVFEYGRTWRLAELPDESVALDGAVLGPGVHADRRRYSFDHHGDCVRHATLATCEQVFDALRVGLDPSGLGIYLNDIDADSVLALWLLLHPEEVRRNDGELDALVRTVGRADALGPARGPEPPLARLVERGTSAPPDEADLAAALEVVGRWVRGERPEGHGPRPPTLAIWLDGGAARTGLVEDGFAGLYALAPFGVLAPSGPDGTVAYSVGKASELVDFDLPRFLELARELEPGWGGGTTVGGAPRHPDGTRSRLEPDAVASLLERAARGPGAGRPVFANVSHHGAAGWEPAQLAAARALVGGGEVVDVPFPLVPPDASDEDVEALAGERAVALPAAAAVAMVQGEATLTLALVRRLSRRGVRCVAATTERHHVDLGDGRSETRFVFVRFREYRV